MGTGPETRPNDNWGVGQMTDGSITSMTEEAASIVRAKRDAEEAVWRNYEDDADEELDLDALSVEELDEIIEGLGENE